MLIQFLIENALVPNRTALYRLIKRNEDGLAIGGDEWGMKGQPKFEDHSKANTQKKEEEREVVTREKFISDQIGKEFIRYNMWHEDGWKGKMFLQVETIRFDSNLNKYGLGYYGGCIPKDVCSFIGNSDKSKKSDPGDKVVCRLYFDPTEYHPTPEMKDGGRNTTFEKLKHYIKIQSNKAGSQVICTGGDSREKYRHKRFACKQKCIQYGSGKSSSCPFSFQVRWDNHGYYIHLLNSPENFHAFGCS